jgi:DNA processing protein
MPLGLDCIHPPFSGITLGDTDDCGCRNAEICTGSPMNLTAAPASSRRMTERHHENRSSGPSYIPPDHVSVFTLGALLGGVRDVLPEQQSRLGFDAKGLNTGVWCAGDAGLIQMPSVAIVGTRNATAEGAARARRLAKELVAAGVVVFSGLAKGIDTEALTSAIQHQGRVVAVIGTPIDRAYPSENRRLQEQIYRDHLLVSQFAPGTKTFPSSFPERNKLMAALSDATAIIEAGETSGTLHQAAECVRLGRWLFIAESIFHDSELTWPRRFEGYDRFRVLTKTEDVISALNPPKI